MSPDPNAVHGTPEPDDLPVIETLRSTVDAELHERIPAWKRLRGSPRRTFLIGLTATAGTGLVAWTATTVGGEVVKWAFSWLVSGWGGGPSTVTSTPTVGARAVVTATETPAVATATVTLAPVVTMTPTTGPTASVGGTAKLPDVFIKTTRLVCATDDFIEATFGGERAPPGYEYRVFAIPTDVEKWYPATNTYQERDGYWARVYTGPAPEYDVHVVLTEQQATDAIDEYIRERERDKDWGRGLPRLPKGSVTLAKQRVKRDCTSRYDTNVREGNPPAPSTTPVRSPRPDIPGR